MSSHDVHLQNIGPQTFILASGDKTGAVRGPSCHEYGLPEDISRWRGSSPLSAFEVVRLASLPFVSGIGTSMTL